MCSYYHLVLAGLLLAVHVILNTVLVHAQNTNFSFSSFGTPDLDSFSLVEDVRHDAANSSFLMNWGASVGTNSTWNTTGTCGRLWHKDKVRMKDSASGKVASFHTAFTFQITGPDSYHSDGLAFTFARNSSLLDETAGSFLCLLNDSNNGQPSNRVFAVEFDTFWNPELNDSSDNHIGVNINSMNSTWSHNLCGDEVNSCKYLWNGGYFTSWIDYNSTSHKLEVSLANGSLYNNIPKPSKPLIEANLSLAGLWDDYMYVGFSASTGLYSEVHQIQSWKFTSSGMPEQGAVQPPSRAAPNSSPGSKIGVIAEVTTWATIVVLSLGLFEIARIVYRWRAFRMKLLCMGADLQREIDRINLYGKFNILVPNSVAPRLFTYKELNKATKNFSRGELLGRGGLGAVYKGTLPSGDLIEVQQMKRESKHGEEGFQAESASLGQIRHCNLVQLRGWCDKEEQLLLVYDYMCNGTLDECLFQSSKRNALSLMLRHSVLGDVAAALSYLHNECQKCMLHRDIKSSNVLLDGKWNAYLADFGLARFFDHQTLEKTTTMTGTLGYIAPEMLYTHKATEESDIYSFGVLMLEVMCGMRPLDTSTIQSGEGVLVDRVWRAHEAGNILQVADSRLEAYLPPSDAKNSGSFGEIELQEASLTFISGNDMHDVDQYVINVPDAETVDKKLIANLLHLGLLCCNPNPGDRPSMRLVSQLLQSSEYMEMSLPPLPVCKPQTQFSGPAQEDRNAGAMEKLESYLKLAEECMEAVKKLSDSRKFNHEQCGYLTEKLKVVIQSASWFVEVSRAECHRPRSSVDDTRLAQNFELLLALAKQTESFVQGSCKYEWIQAAVSLSNVSEYVSSLGFNLELCRIAFRKECVATKCLTLVEVGDINKAEVEIVEQKASLDAASLLRKVTLELNSLEGENRDLASYLLQRLLRVGPNPTSDDESFLGKLFNWVVSGEKLGRGASAVVHKAMWLGTPVAKKTFDGSENLDFLKEVKILSQLCHPNVTSMFCYAKSKRKCSIIMELMDDDLHKLMERRCGDSNDSQPFFILEAVDIMLQVGEGVNYLHRKGIVHRDLKSMNILVKNVKAKDAEIGYVQAKVTDFGLSKKKDKTTTYSNQTFNTGTNRWMPPEVMTLTTDSQKSWISRPEKLPNYPFKCDTYSFGMVCYEILTGNVPFSNICNPNDIKRRIMEDRERPILPSDCPSKLKALIEKCWSQEPKERPTFAVICLELKYLKYSLMTGNDSELAPVGSSDDQ